MKPKKTIYNHRNATMYKRLVLAFAAAMLLFVSCKYAQNSAQAARTEKKQNNAEGAVPALRPFVSQGLPADAYPAAYLNCDTVPFQQLDAAQQVRYLEESCLQSYNLDAGNFHFFVQPIAVQNEYDGEFYNVYMYDETRKTVSKIFSHHVDNYPDMQIESIVWNYHVLTYSEPYTDQSGKEGLMHYQKGTPVVVITAKTVPFSPHAADLTIILNPLAHSQKVLKEKFVGFVKNDDSSLAAAEQGSTKRMILTTASTLSTKDLPTPEEADFLTRSYITPSIHVYSTSGVRLGGLTLPPDEIDCMR